MNIIGAAKTNILDQIKTLRQEVDQRHTENNVQAEKTAQFRDEIRELISTKPAFEWIEKNFAKKDLIALELEHLKEEVIQVGKKMEELLKRR